MKINELIITEGSDLICPNCDENLGKDTENSKSAYCSNCGKSGIKNPYGSDDDEQEDD